MLAFFEREIKPTLEDYGVEVTSIKNGFRVQLQMEDWTYIPSAVWMSETGELPEGLSEEDFKGPEDDFARLKVQLFLLAEGDCLLLTTGKTAARRLAPVTSMTCGATLRLCSTVIGM